MGDKPGRGWGRCPGMWEGFLCLLARELCRVNNYVCKRIGWSYRYVWGVGALGGVRGGFSMGLGCWV